MARWVGLAAAAGALASASAAHAATLQIQNAAVRVVIVPEARSDVSVTITHVNPRLPLKITTGLDGDVTVDGGLGWGWFGAPISCGPAGPGGWMIVWGRGRFAYEDLPEVVVKAPLDARVASNAAVFGAVGPADSLELRAANCGAWNIANVRGALVVESSGSARIRAGDASEMTLRAAGSGDIQTLSAGKRLDALASGSGDIAVAEVAGPVDLGASGSGSIRIAGGQATTMRVRTTGSGDIAFAGRADAVTGGASGSGRIDVAGVGRGLDVTLTGSGDIRVGEARGDVGARLSGSGDLSINGGHVSNLKASVSGSGGVSFGGLADKLEARTSGSGWVRVNRVAGPMATQSTGSGRVVVAQR